MDGYPTVRRQFIEAIVSTLATASAVVATAEFCICGRTYGESILKDATVMLLEELTYHDTFVPDAVEQIAIPCGHHFCIPCIGK
jgi:hypothetical protein